jgi:general secretion pathway protein K
MTFSKAKTSKGAALISVLWTIAVLASIAAATTLDSRTDVRLSRNLIEHAQVRQAHASGLRLGVANIVQRSRSKVAPGAPLRQEYTFAWHKLSVTVKNEAGRIDINKAPRELILGLVMQFVVEDRAQRITDAVMDWRDSDEDRRVSGAEAGDYYSSGLNYGPANANFLSVGDLRFVLDVDEDLFQSMQAATTVYSDQAGIFPTAASTEVLQAAGGIINSASGYSRGRSQAVSGLRRKLIALRPGNVYRVETTVITNSGTVARNGTVILFEPARRPEPFVVLASNLTVSTSESRAVK